MENIMAKVLVLYFSKYGTTKKYAEWIASELNGDIGNVKNIKPDMLENYDTIIIGSGLYAGKIEGVKLLIDNYEAIKEKKLILFTCGLADYSKTENINNIRKRLEKIIPADLKQKIKIYCLRGGINYSGLNLKHKIMMWLLKRMVLKKRIEELNEENRAFIETYGQTVDFTNKNSIMEIIEYCT
jgi:menaquinone-dependent protoporphyrinogen IX oxidase